MRYSTNMGRRSEAMPILESSSHDPIEDTLESWQHELPEYLSNYPGEPDGITKHDVFDRFDTRLQEMKNIEAKGDLPHYSGTNNFFFYFSELKYTTNDNFRFFLL